MDILKILLLFSYILVSLYMVVRVFYLMTTSKGFKSPPNISTTKNNTKYAIKFLTEQFSKKNKFTLCDLGCGSGNVLRDVAKEFPNAKLTGYEISLITYWIAKFKCRNFKNIQILKKSFWEVNLKSFDVIYVFMYNHFMPKLEKKFNKELKKNSLVITNYFVLPNTKPIKQIKEKVFRGNIFQNHKTVTLYKF